MSDSSSPDVPLASTDSAVYDNRRNSSSSEGSAIGAPPQDLLDIDEPPSPSPVDPTEDNETKEEETKAPIESVQPSETHSPLVSTIVNVSSVSSSALLSDSSSLSLSTPSSSSILHSAATPRTPVIDPSNSATFIDDLPTDDHYDHYVLNSPSFNAANKTFSNCLTHNFDVVIKQVETGVYAAKRIASLLKKVCQFQEEFSRKLQSALDHEKTKLMRLQGDQMKLQTKGWNQTQEIIAKLAKSHANEAAKVDYEIIQPIQLFHRQSEEKLREILVEERKATGDMAKARDEVVKGLANCNKLIYAAKATEQKEKAKAAEAKKGLFSSLSSAFSKNSKALQGEAAKAATSYAAAVQTANKRQQKYLESDLPKIFTALQSLEKIRLDTSKLRLMKFSDLAHKCAEERVHLFSDLRSMIDPMDSEKDIERFVESWIEEHGHPTPVRPFIYGLPCTPKDIEAGRLEANPNSVFRTSLAHCMQLQASAAPTLKIPRIVPTLIEAVRDLNGYQTEGIFRISAGKQEVEILREAFDRGNYGIKPASPHAAAALLKEWLRLLAEPLIPESLYESAILSVKEKALAESKSHDAVIFDIFRKLPNVNQRVIEELSSMACKIAKPENCQINKMNIENLAIVFSPSFLRNPSEDPIQLLQSAKFETKFTAALFKVIGEKMSNGGTGK